MKIIPGNLKSLQLDLSYNKLGYYAENMINLGKSLEFLPGNLESFKLILCWNSLDGKFMEMKWLREGMK